MHYSGAWGGREQFWHGVAGPWWRGRGSTTADHQGWIHFICGEQGCGEGFVWEVKGAGGKGLAEQLAPGQVTLVQKQMC